MGSPSGNSPVGCCLPPPALWEIKEFCPLRRARRGAAPPPRPLLKKGNENFTCRAGKLDAHPKSPVMTAPDTRLPFPRHFAKRKNFAGLSKRPRIPKAAPLAASRKRRNTLFSHNAGRGRRPASGGRWRRGKPTYGVSPLLFASLILGAVFRRYFQKPSHDGTRHPASHPASFRQT